VSWTRYGPTWDYVRAAVSPRFQPNNFRPVGHYYFRALERVFGLDFPGYVAVLQALHLFNVWLVWMLARRLGADPVAAAAACVLFALHMALFDAFWKPMYVFDVLCAGFCLGAILLYARGQWIASFVCFWLAYKSKEVAVMLPAVLAAYEVWFGARRWKPLVPFFAASLSFGLQGIWLNPNHDNDYTFRFTPAALWKTVSFYSEKMVLVPYLGLLVPLAARNRRAWFGFAAMLLFFMPMLFLPGRLFSAYCYVPFIGLAIAISAMPRVWVLAGLLAFIPLDLHSLRVERRATLAHDDEARTWVTTVAAFASTHPAVDDFVFSGKPAYFGRWGVEGAIKYCFDRYDAKVYALGEPIPSGHRVALLTWGGNQLAISVRSAE